MRIQPARMDAGAVTANRLLDNDEEEDIVIPRAAVKRSQPDAAESGSDDSDSASEGSSSGSDSGDDSASSGSGSPAKDGDDANAGGGGGSDDSDDGFVRRKRAGKKPRKPAQKKAAAGPAKKRKRKTYIEEAAEVAGDDEDEEEDAEYAALKKAGVTRDEYQARVMARYDAENKALQAKRAAEKSAEQIAQDIEAKYKSGGYAIGEEELEGDLGGALAAQANLPDMRDPKLWMMRCKEGSEMAILIALLNKFVAKAEMGDRLGIMSAASTSKGVIFVESYREAQVRQAVAGITDLYGWKPDAITLVPVAQMTAALHVSASRDVFKRGMYVRFGRGTYKGDLAQVVEILEGGSKLLVRSVPRINYKALSLPKEQRKAVGRKAGPRPSQRFYDRKTYVDESGGDADILNVLKWGMRVDKIGSNYYGSDGMLYKEIKSEHVTAHGPAPSMEELSQFKSKNESNDDDKKDDEDVQKSAEESLLDTLRTAKSAPTAEIMLEPGDSVVVVKGDLAGLTGHVVAVNPGGTFTLMPSAESSELLGLTEKLEIPVEEIAKTFDVGDHVKVLAGVYRGETGTVLASKPVTEHADDVPVFVATLLLDSGQKTVDVFVKDLSKTTEVVTSVTSVEGYELHDLVEIKGQTENKPDAGCVVQLGQRELSILLTSGQIQKVPVQEIRGKANYRGATGMAVSQGVQLAVGDVVRVIQGSPDVMNMTGTIKHIYGMRLFLHSFARQDNSGIFVVRPQQVVLASRRSAGAEQKTTVMTTVGRIFGGPRGKGKGDMGRSVVIVKGRWKGRLGMIRNETDTHYSVELHQAQQKHVTILKSECKVVGDEKGSINGAAQPAMLLGHQTPHLGGATPAFGAGGATPGMGMGGATPMFGMGGATPMFGSKTPYGGGATPMYGAGAQTPMYGAGAQTPFIGGGKTPMMGGTTPAYVAGGRTPMGMPGISAADAIKAAIGKAATAANINADTDVPWIDKGVKVAIAGGQYAGKSGVVRGVSDKQPMATVFLDQAGQVVSIQIADLRPQLATTGEYVRVLSGLHAGKRLLVMNTVGVNSDGTFEEDADVVVRTETGDTDVLPPAVVVRCMEA